MKRLLSITLLAAANAGCFDPQLADGEIACGEADCPEGMTCADDGLCYRAPEEEEDSNRRRGVLAVAYRGDHNRLYAQCDGGLRLVWTAEEDKESRAAAWQDIDGDGIPELAIAVGESPGGNGGEQGEQSVTLYRVAAAGLDRVSTEDLWTTPRDIAWGDFAGDGAPSLAIATDHDQLRVLGYGGDGEVSSIWISDEAHGSSGVAVGDFDDNGHDDLVIAARDETSVVYSGFAEGLRITWRATLIDDSQSAAVADYDGDGDLDFALANVIAPVRVYENQGDEMVLGWSSSAVLGAESVDFADVDRDGNLDLAVGTEVGLPTQVFRNLDRGGAERFDNVWSSTEHDDTQAVVWADPDGDGDPDLVVGNDGVPLRLYRNDGGELTLAWSSGEIGRAWDLSWATWTDGPDPCDW